ncbi:lipid scramblase CLPTM1L-like [Paramacrobiotus metropolitanus]|uniref:lipid scramblase CLPTM1L-like n=1 Tax=Paramacrobiotus metropolitanus TaxID=2943436 RepID=UPI0024456C94|nr:lipid scramblase CLPTM1L-like [Paramacrobiotus metropolitanus]
MPSIFSLGSILTVIGVAYVSHTIYTFYNIYFPPWCTSTKSASDCITPKYPCDAIDLLFEAYLSRSSSPPDKTALAKTPPSHVRIAHRLLPCSAAWEETIPIELGSLLPSVKSKGSPSFVGLHMHVLVLPVQKGKLKDIDTLRTDMPEIVYQKVSMTKMMAEERTAMNLIQGDVDDSAQEKAVNDTAQKKSSEKILHWHSKLRWSVMDTPISFDRMSLPPEIYPHMKIKSENNMLRYLPILYLDTLSAKKDEFIPVRSAAANLTVEYNPISVGKIRIITMIAGSLEHLKSFGLQESDLEDVIAIFTETNFYILAFTIAVTVLHLVFDFLAFKNDINFWRKRDTVVGMSGRTILWRAFSQIIVFLYLLEEKSSLLISIPAGVACFIEMWKVLKLWKFAGFERNGWRIRMVFRSATAAERSCDDIDAVFVKKLSYLLLPLCIGGAIYSLYYVPHKSWYSWTIQSAVNGVYAFGFLFMIPQLYLNYRLKSVAHLPWKVFSYKALNTFIDDLFAFIVKMPLAHRLACFRDDIIFVFYLAQWWMYPVDKSRANEFGQSFAEEEAETAKQNLLAKTKDDGKAEKETKKDK